MEGDAAEGTPAAAGQGGGAEGHDAEEDKAAAAERLHAAQLALELRGARGEPGAAAAEGAAVDDAEEVEAGAPATSKVCHAHGMKRVELV